ncbi:hypothetical protein [Micromonospora robiginosa]|uniref:Uncharacterized protein n=1 Tax=Micromonospora robiginosa TaxID=2749844 RepID=A0A7L6AZ19_9ACTN|nr:hypothetical protein [Micromonospora ferruginea]QLQ34903.1 hypothetical protein H1D33_19685 [Micromonospora ferruginea]
MSGLRRNHLPSGKWEREPTAGPYIASMPGRRERMRRELGAFLKGYGRSSRRRNGMDPNDRTYSRKLETEIKRMRPDDLDRLMRDDEDEDR